MSNDNENGKPPELVFNIGEVISGYTIVSKIDEGGFGQVFKVTKDKQMFAMKLEPSSMDGGSAIKLEISVLKDLPKNLVFPAMINGGRKPKFHFLVLELLGDNLKTLKGKSPNPEAFSDGTAARLGIQCLFALKQMHDAGFLHRDVKPSNFAVGLHASTCRRIMLFDFGLARKFIKQELRKPVATKSLVTARLPNDKLKLKKSPSKHIRPVAAVQNRMRASNRSVDMRPPAVVASFRKPRPHTDFRGTELYASPNAHELKELGRTDDIWSMLYMVSEFFKELPWSTQDAIPTDVVKNQCTMLRLFTDETNPGRLTPSMMEQLEFIDRMVKERNYYHCPDYQMVYTFLHDMMKKSGVTWESPYDWEKVDETTQGTKRKRESATTANLWEDPGEYFKIDPWRKLEVPEIASTPPPRSAKQRRADMKGPRKLSKEDPSLNVDDEKESLNLQTPQRSQKKDSRSVKQDGKTPVKQDCKSVYEVKSTKKGGFSTK